MVTPLPGEVAGLLGIPPRWWRIAAGPFDFCCGGTRCSRHLALAALNRFLVRVQGAGAMGRVVGVGGWGLSGAGRSDPALCTLITSCPPRPGDTLSVLTEVSDDRWHDHGMKGQRGIAELRRGLRGYSAGRSVLEDVAHLDQRHCCVRLALLYGLRAHTKSRNADMIRAKNRVNAIYRSRGFSGMGTEIYNGV
jgi:hypothetical protein